MKFSIKRVLIRGISIIFVFLISDTGQAMTRTALVTEEMGVVLVRKYPVIPKQPMHFFHGSSLVESPIMRRPVVYPWVRFHAGKDTFSSPFLYGNSRAVGLGRRMFWGQAFERAGEFLKSVPGAVTSVGVSLMGVAAFCKAMGIDLDIIKREWKDYWEENPCATPCSVGHFELGIKKKLKDEIEKKRNSPVSVLFVYGPGDAGKTALVKDAVCELRREKDFLDYYFYVSNDEKTLEKQLEDFHACCLRIEEKNPTFVNLGIKNMLLKKKGFVITFDNVESLSAVEKYIDKLNHPNSKGLFIVTTRDENWIYGNSNTRDTRKWKDFPVVSLDLEEATKILWEHLDPKLIEERKIDKEKTKKILEIIGTYTGTVVSILDSLNSQEIKPDEFLAVHSHRPSDRDSVDIVKKHLKKLIEHNSHVETLLHKLSIVSNGEIISFELLELLENINALALDGNVFNRDAGKETAKRELKKNIVTLINWGILKEAKKPTTSEKQKLVYVMPQNYRDAAKQLYLEKHSLSWREWGKAWITWQKKEEILERKLLKAVVEGISDSYQLSPDKFKGYESEIERLKKI